VENDEDQKQPHQPKSLSASSGPNKSILTNHGRIPIDPETPVGDLIVELETRPDIGMDVESDRLADLVALVRDASALDFLVALHDEVDGGHTLPCDVVGIEGRQRLGRFVMFFHGRGEGGGAMDDVDNCEGE
jgi:hypothetical protein